MRRAAIALVMLVTACSSGGSSTPASTPKTVHITYQVRGFANYPEITYRTGDGSVQTHAGSNSIQTDLAEDIGVDVDEGDEVSLTVKSTFLGDRDVTCVIVGSDGQEIARNTATGRNSTATCEGKAA